MTSTIGILKEETDHRVIIDPDTVKRLTKLGTTVKIQKTAGKSAYFSDEMYLTAGAKMTTEAVVLTADVICAVNLPKIAKLQKLRAGSTLVTTVQAHNNLDVLQLLSDKKVDLLALELVPRITRAQSMDVLSSQAASAGYRATLNAANHYRGFFPMLTTAAGTVRPAKVVIIGAGVAGLQAIATAKRLGAVVEAYDIRPAAKEQVESLGAKMIDTGVNAEGEGGYARTLTDSEKEQQAAVLAKHIAQANVVISTAAIPGKPSPTIITTAMLDAMQPGSVVVDMAAEGGGNCEQTVVGQVITRKDVILDGSLHLPSSMAMNASEMLAKNLYNFLFPFIKDGTFTPNMEDEVLKSCLLLKQGEPGNDIAKQLLAEERHD